jgi:uncharacterized protein (DUF1330 family)
MSAYIILIRDHTRDGAELERYAELARGARDGHDLSPLAFYGDLATLEGAQAEGAVLLRFPDMAAARAWYDSPQYQAAKVHRHLGADYRVLLIDGVD